MDKRDLRIRAKGVVQSFSTTDVNGHTLTAVCENQRTLDTFDGVKSVRLEISRPESPSEARLKLRRAVSRDDVSTMLDALDEVLRLIQSREHMDQRPPEKGIEFFVEVFDDAKVGAFERRDAEPAFFIELRNDKESIRCSLKDLGELDALKQVLLSLI